MYSQSMEPTENKDDDVFRVIPVDIWADIMCRLPDKDLFRSKCVSKIWCFFISEVCIPLRPRPVVGLYFRSFPIPRGYEFESLIHRAEGVPAMNNLLGDWIPLKEDRFYTSGHYVSFHQNGCPQLFGWVERATSSFSFLPFTTDPEDLIDCCNGLHLFFDTESFQYHVCNPLNKQSVLVVLPESTPRSERYDEEYSFNAALVFDPRISPHYKVVRYDRLFRHYYVSWEEIRSPQALERRIRESQSRKKRLFLDIYHSFNRRWSRHSVNIDPLILEQEWVRCSTYFNGSLFRLSYSWHLIQFEIIGLEEGEMVSARLIELPLTYKMCQGLIGCIGVLMGMLCYANEYGNNIHIWSLDEKKKGWSLRHMIDIDVHLMSTGLVRMREGGGPYTKWVGPVSFHPTSNVIFLGTPVVILSYNLDNNKLEELVRIENDIIVPGCLMPALPNVSLFSPFGEASNPANRIQITN
ncbi:hypothetical protein OROGR_010370 [Orobanche gracilis]